MQIDCFEDYKNMVDWYYENEYSESTLYEDLYPLKLMATAHVEKVIEKAYNEGLHLTEAAAIVKETIKFYASKENSNEC